MKGKDIPAFKLNAHALENPKVLKALCSLETRDVSVQDLIIEDMGFECIRFEWRYS